MPQLSYLKQIARRAKGELPMLMPPRLPLMGSEMPQPLEISNQIPSIPQSNQLPAPTSLASTSILEDLSPSVSSPFNIPEEFSGQANTNLKHLSPSVSSPFNIPEEFSGQANTNQNSSLLIETPMPGATTSLSLASTQESGSRTETRSKVTRSQIDDTEARGEISSHSKAFAVTSKEITPILEPISSISQGGEFNSQIISRQQIPEPVAQSGQNLQQLFVPNYTLYHVDTTYSQSENRVEATAPVETDRKKQEGQTQSLLPQTAIAPPPTSLTSQVESPKGNTVHIGSIDVQIVTPPAAPPKVAPAVSKPGSTSALSRGFTSAFGLRQT